MKLKQVFTMLIVLACAVFLFACKGNKEAPEPTQPHQELAEPNNGEAGKVLIQEVDILERVEVSREEWPNYKPLSKNYSNVKITDDFESDVVYVSLLPEYSKEHRVPSMSFFKWDNIASVRDCTGYAPKAVRQAPLQQIFRLTLIEQTKEKVLELIKHLETFPEVYGASPNGRAYLE